MAHSPSGTMKPISSASGMNMPGEIMPFSGWLPADQRLDAADLVALEIDDRLVVQLELAGDQRLAQVVLHGAPRLHLRVHLGLEEAVGAAPVALGAIERQVGVPHQLVGRHAVGRADGDADAGADHHLVAVDVVGLAHRLDDAMRQRRWHRRAGRCATCRTANSSPPMRAIVSVSRTSARRRSATICSSLSPADGPACR